MVLTELIDVIDCHGRTLTPCRRKVAEREVRLGRAKWLGRGKIRLRFDPFAYRYIRLKVLERDRHICYWCGGVGNTMDHVIPWSKGGRTTMGNCIAACEECNGVRGDMPAEEFAKLRSVPPPCPEASQPARTVAAGPMLLPPRPAKAPGPIAITRPLAVTWLLDGAGAPVSRRLYY